MTEEIKLTEFAGVSHLGIPRDSPSGLLRFFLSYISKAMFWLNTIQSLKIKYDTVQIYRNYADEIENLYLLTASKPIYFLTTNPFLYPSPFVLLMGI